MGTTKRAPAARCAHGRSKYRCKLCGTGYCAHGNQKGQCRTCGRGYCAHGARRDRCATCGTARCRHGHLRSRCAECQPLAKLVALSTQCRVCGVTQVCRARMLIRGGTGMCAGCEALANNNNSVGGGRVGKERRLHERLCELGVPRASSADNKVVGGQACGVGRRRPDLAWVTPTYVLNLEIDEDSHMARLPSCELSKAQDTRFGAEHGSKPLLLFRYNPDQYELDDDDDRVAYLAAVVRWALQNVRAHDLDPLRPNIVYLFYHDRASKHVDAAHEAGFRCIELPHYGRRGRPRWCGASEPLGLKNLSLWFGRPGGN